MYIDKEGKRFTTIKSLPALTKAMRIKYGHEWKMHVINDYGAEQLGVSHEEHMAMYDFLDIKDKKC